MALMFERNARQLLKSMTPKSHMAEWAIGSVALYSDYIQIISIQYHNTASMPSLSKTYVYFIYNLLRMAQV
jgi:hypothetical protein